MEHGEERGSFPRGKEPDGHRFLHGNSTKNVSSRQECGKFALLEVLEVLEVQDIAKSPCYWKGNEEPNRQMAEDAERDEGIDNVAEKKPEIVSEMTFHYVKSEFARTLHVDGFFGGVTPKGDGLALGVFSERHPYPDSSLYRKKPNTDKLVEILSERKITRKGVIREIESTLVMNLVTARNLREWLNEHIQRLEAIEKTREL